MDAATLVACGLTLNESKVYLALLRLNSASAVDIAKESGVHRVNAYDVLERLREKGLVSILLVDRRKVYKVAHPRQLLTLLKEKEQLLHQAVPELEQQFKAQASGHQVFQFSGPEGVMQAYFMMLEQGKTIYGVGGSGLNREYLKHRHELWNKERLQRKIPMKVLYYQFTKKRKARGWKDRTVAVRYLPDKYQSVGMVDICGDLVVHLLPLEQNPLALVIENKILADTYRNFFSFMWEHASV